MNVLDALTEVISNDKMMTNIDSSGTIIFKYTETIKKYSYDSATNTVNEIPTNITTYKKALIENGCSVVVDLYLTAEECQSSLWIELPYAVNKEELIKSTVNSSYTIPQLTAGDWYLLGNQSSSVLNLEEIMVDESFIGDNIQVARYNDIDKVWELSTAGDGYNIPAKSGFWIKAVSGTTRDYVVPIRYDYRQTGIGDGAWHLVSFSPSEYSKFLVTVKDVIDRYNAEKIWIYDGHLTKWFGASKEKFYSAVYTRDSTTIIKDSVHDAGYRLIERYSLRPEAAGTSVSDFETDNQGQYVPYGEYDTIDKLPFIRYKECSEYIQISDGSGGITNLLDNDGNPIIYANIDAYLFIGSISSSSGYNNVTSARKLELDDFVKYSPITRFSLGNDSKYYIESSGEYVYNDGEYVRILNNDDPFIVNGVDTSIPIKDVEKYLINSALTTGNTLVARTDLPTTQLCSANLTYKYTESEDNALKVYLLDRRSGIWVKNPTQNYVEKPAHWETVADDSKTITYPSLGVGWHLLGNPFSRKLDVDDLDNIGIKGGYTCEVLWYYDAFSGQWVKNNYNIPAFSGFWVKLSSSTSGGDITGYTKGKPSIYNDSWHLLAQTTNNLTEDLNTITKTQGLILRQYNASKIWTFKDGVWKDGASCVANQYSGGIDIVVEPWQGFWLKGVNTRTYDNDQPFQIIDNSDTSTENQTDSPAEEQKTTLEYYFNTPAMVSDSSSSGQWYMIGNPTNVHYSLVGRVWLSGRILAKNYFEDKNGNIAVATVNGVSVPLDSFSALKKVADIVWTYDHRYKWRGGPVDYTNTTLYNYILKPNNGIWIKIKPNVTIPPVNHKISSIDTNPYVIPGAWTLVSEWFGTSNNTFADAISQLNAERIWLFNGNSNMWMSHIDYSGTPINEFDGLNNVAMGFWAKGRPTGDYSSVDSDSGIPPSSG